LLVEDRDNKVERAKMKVDLMAKIKLGLKRISGELAFRAHSGRR
jgi:hypothetical protein